MKIRTIDTTILSVPTPKPIALEYPEHRLVVASIETDEGPSGLGYSLVFGAAGAESIQVYLETRLKSLLIGEDPLMIGRLWERMYRHDRGIRRQGVAAYAISAIDIGLWDLAGKVAGLPLYKLWGGVRDRVAVYGSGGWPRYPLEAVIEEAQRYAAMGCRYYKMKIHDPDPRVNRRRVEAVRTALGDGVRLMVDVNQRLDVLGNIQQARALKLLDLSRVRLDLGLQRLVQERVGHAGLHHLQLALGQVEHGEALPGRDAQRVERLLVLGRRLRPGRRRAAHGDQHGEHRRGHDCPHGAPFRPRVSR